IEVIRTHQKIEYTVHQH
ncbi:hypothetical protein GWI33_012272, partial [Rhynchophorus ferrugineus]